MPILVDYNAVAISKIHAVLSGNRTLLDDEDKFISVIRITIIKSLLDLKKRFSKQFGDLIICSDYKSWRKEFFPFYKIGRQKKREAEEAAGDKTGQMIWKGAYKVVREIQSTFPYEVLIVDGAEADDIIAILSEYFFNFDFTDVTDLSDGNPKPVLIISGDKDFNQLHKYSNLKQWSPSKGEFIKLNESPKAVLRELIIRGDVSDSIPNFLSPNNTFADGMRSKPIPEKRLFDYLTKEPEEFCENQDELNNYYRNQTLIDFSHIPEKIKNKILSEHMRYMYKDKPNKTSMLNYIVKNRLGDLLSGFYDF